VRKIGGIILATVLILVTLAGSSLYSVRGLEYLIAMYILYLAYEVMGFHRLISAFRPFLVAFSVYLALNVVYLNLPDVGLYLKPIEPLILPFLLSLALVKFELPVRFQPIITTAGLLLSAFFGYQLISLLPFKQAGEIGTIFAILLVLLAVTTLLPSVHERFEFLRYIRSFVITTALIVSVYFTLIRPLLLNRPGLINVIDWLIVAGVFFKASSIVRRSFVVDESELVRIHEFRVGLKKEEIIESIEKAKREFIEKGLKSPLIAVISHVLFSAGWRLDDVARVISFVISHEDEKIPKFAFGWERKLIERRNKKRREEVIKSLENYFKKEGVGFGS